MRETLTESFIACILGTPLIGAAPQVEGHGFSGRAPVHRCSAGFGVDHGKNTRRRPHAWILAGIGRT